MTDIERTVRFIVGNYTDDAVTSVDQNLRNDLGLDSLDIVEMYFDIDKAFRVNIPDEVWEAARVATVNDIIVTVTKYVGS